ncbi:MAG: hypothetical protein GX799_02650 [Crenarchaeota archaeon]|nr:hypothetical protein [Thermoproteota archaeon]
MPTKTHPLHSNNRWRQPRVRGMLMWFADKTGLHYNTGATKDLYRQLEDNPK